MGFNNVRREEMYKLERFTNVTEIADRMKVFRIQLFFFSVFLEKQGINERHHYELQIQKW